jgi:5-methylcytosine-specific restriction endonuclease McrA
MNNRSDSEELKLMEELTRIERRAQVRWLKQLAVIEDRRLYSLSGFPSLWSYVRESLGYSEGTAGKRIQVLRAARRFPIIFELITERKLSLSSASRLSAHLTEDNHAELFLKANGKSVREVEELVAALSPKPDVRDSVRAVAGTTAAAQATLDVTPMANAPKPRLEAKPIAEARYHANFTMGKGARDKQERLKALTRHLPKPPSMEDVYDAGLDAYLKKHDPDVKLATTRAAKPRLAAGKAGRYISRDKLRTVRANSQSRCAYVSPDGKRCDATGNLHVDHIQPHALGGTNEPSNLRLLCASHNQLMAIRTYGEKHMGRWVRTNEGNSSVP